MARHFGIKPPSISDWINRGTIDKAKLDELFTYFADVVGPDHWDTTRSIAKNSAHAVNQSAATYHLPQRHARPLVQELIAIAERIDDAGINRLIGMATLLADSQPHVKAKPRSSA